jgi:hypothetical protein
MAEARRKAAQAAKEPPPEDGISANAETVALQIRNNASTHLRIGDVIDIMQNEWNAAEKSKRVEDKAYAVREFNRQRAYSDLVMRFPWLDHRHGENPDRIWFTEHARKTTEFQRSLADGSLSRDQYKLAR